MTSPNTKGKRTFTQVVKKMPEVSRTEISYSSTLLFLWAVTLAGISLHCGFRFQAATVVAFSTIALTTEHGETRLLMPLLFLSERCFDHALKLGHMPIEFYSSMLLAYLSLIACKAERTGKSARDKNVVLETVMYAVVGLAVVFAIIQDKVISLGAAAYVASGHACFLSLKSLIGENEAVLVSSIAGFYMCDVFINNNLSVDGGRETIFSLYTPGYLTSLTHIAGRGMILSAIYIATLMGLLARFCRVPENRNSKSSAQCISRKRTTIAFIGSSLTVSLIMFFVISYQLNRNVITWLLGYLLSSGFRKWCLITWLTCIPIAVLLIDAFTRNVRQTVRRKLFHFLAVVSFTPAAMIDPAFSAFAFSTATALAVVIEAARFFKVYGTRGISRFVSHHIDNRDSLNGIVRSHIYLIIGIGLPFMMRYRLLNIDSAPTPAIVELSTNLFPGIISLGIVDSSAAIIGSSFLLSWRRTLGRYLKNKVFTERANTSIVHKTTTGTIGGLICGLIFWCFVLTVAEVPLTGPVWYSFILVLVCTVTECFLDGIDNLQLPVVVMGATYSIFSLLIPFKDLWVNERIRRPNPTTAQSLASALFAPLTNWPSV